MAWIKTIAEEEATGKLREVYEDIASTEGAVVNAFKLESLRPDALRDHVALYRTLHHSESPISQAELEAIAVVVSVENQCRY